jgi:hypothetical protein
MHIQDYMHWDSGTHAYTLQPARAARLKIHLTCAAARPTQLTAATIAKAVEKACREILL